MNAVSRHPDFDDFGRDFETTLDMPAVVAALDVGTTTLRCHLYNSNAEVIGSASDTIEILIPEAGREEIDPEIIFQKVVVVINEAMNKAGVTGKQVTCLGMSCQRCSFVTWRKSSGVPFHNVITWRDLRADFTVRSLNNSILLKAFRATSCLAHLFTRQNRFLAASQMKVMNTQVTPRLHWALNNVPELKEAVQKNDAAFGTLDTWLLYKLSGGKAHVTDVSHAACTGFYDPFIMDWSIYFKYMFSVPHQILPNVVDTSTHFCDTEPSLFGAAIPITCSVADQSASMFGNGCFKKGAVKVTLGTGSFVNVNTGDKPHASINGLYPIVGWRMRDRTTYLAEGASNDTGCVIVWAQQVGYISNPAESANLAYSVNDSDGVFFIPAFSGIQAPINNPQAACGMIGIKPTTRKEHIVRALLESIAYRIDQLYEIVMRETEADLTNIKVDGGVSQNDFIMQLVADLTNTQIILPTSPEQSALGAALLAGLGAGVWSSENDLIQLRGEGKVFNPHGRKPHEINVATWRKATSRFLNWYPSAS